jgi:hypothetical protein
VRRYVAGIVNHGSYEDLARCLASLSQQDARPEAVFVVDTGVDPSRLQALAGSTPRSASSCAPTSVGAPANRILARVEHEHPASPTSCS